MYVYIIQLYVLPAKLCSSVVLDVFVNNDIFGFYNGNPFKKYSQWNILL